MKIATFNINGISARLPNLIRWLDESAPDVACLQELKSPQDRFPEEELKAVGYNAIWKGQKSWNGVAILAKGMEIKEIRDELPGDPEDDQSRFIEAEVGGKRIIGIYLPNGNPFPGPKFDYKLWWMERLEKHLATLVSGDLPTVVTGDFNIIPDAHDVYKVERVKNDALYQPQSRDGFARLIEQGWTDVVRYFYPDETIYTYWDYFRNAFPRNAGMRIDHFLVNPDLLPKLASAGVDKFAREWEKPSDHAPVWIEIAD